MSTKPLTKRTDKQRIASEQIAQPYYKIPALRDEFETQESLQLLDQVFGDVFFGRGVEREVRKDRQRLRTLYFARPGVSSV